MVLLRYPPGLRDTYRCVTRNHTRNNFAKRHDPAELVWPPLALILRFDYSICF